MAAGLVAGWLPHAAATAVGPISPPWDGLVNLPMGVVSMVLALALRRDEPREEDPAAGYHSS